MNSEQVLDFQHIRHKLADVCFSAIAKEYALNLQPMHNRQKIEDALDETVEAMRSLEQEVEQPISGTKDIRTTCTKSRKEIILTREELWAGNTEPPLWSVFTDPENMIRYTWNSYPKYAPLMAEARRNHPDKRYIEFRTPREAKKFLQAVQLRGSI